MAKITYSGDQAAFSFDGVQIGKGTPVDVTAVQLATISKGKAFKALLGAGDIAITDGDIAEDESHGEDLGIKEVRAALKDLGIAFTTKETLEQLQAKLAQVTE